MATVSVIIPVYNCEKYVADAIQSVLNQTYQNLEIIVVDDGSTDHSAQVVRSFQPTVQYFHQPNQGMGAARNYGISLAKGDYFSFLDADDLWTPNKIRMQISVLAQAPELDLISGHVQQFYSPDLPEDLRADIHCPSQPIPAHVVPAMLIRRESFFRVGMFE